MLEAAAPEAAQAYRLTMFKRGLVDMMRLDEVDDIALPPGADALPEEDREALRVGLEQRRRAQLEKLISELAAEEKLLARAGIASSRPIDVPAARAGI